MQDSRSPPITLFRSKLIFVRWSDTLLSLKLYVLIFSDRDPVPTCTCKGNISQRVTIEYLHYFHKPEGRFIITKACSLCIYTIQGTDVLSIYCGCSVTYDFP